MTVENLMHPPKKCNCDCCCNCQPKTYGPLPKSENNFDSLNKLGEMISEVMQKGEKKTLSAAPDVRGAHPLWLTLPVKSNESNKII